MVACINTAVKLSKSQFIQVQQSCPISPALATCMTWTVTCCCCCSLQPAVAPDAEDQEALLTVRGIWSLLQPNLGSQQDDKQKQQVWNEIYPLIPELLPGLGLTGETPVGPNGKREINNFG